jgi:hypothetical protein
MPLSREPEYVSKVPACWYFCRRTGFDKGYEMPALISAKVVEKVLRDSLLHDGYDIERERMHGETGADIIAQKGTEKLCIEVIAFKSSPPARSRDFYEVFFRAVSRLKDEATLCVIALPIRFRDGLPQRVNAIGLAWRRIGVSFPELKIWLVDTSEGSITRTDWNSWYAHASD